MNNTTSSEMCNSINGLRLLILLFIIIPVVGHSHSAHQEKFKNNTDALTLKDVQGNWVNGENGVWTYGFYPTYAVAEGAFWDYEKVTFRKGKLQIQLRRGKETQTLYALPDKGLLKVGTSEKQMTTYSQQLPASPDFKNYNREGFKSPVVRRDSFTLSGILDGYDRKKDDYKYIQVIYNPIIEDDQANYIAELDSLGRFSMKFPLLSPQDIMLRFGNAMAGFYASPGSGVMIRVNKAYFENIRSLDDFITFIKARQDMLFMGDDAMLNTEITEYRPVNFGVMTPIESQQQTEKLDAPAYQQFRQGKMNEQLAVLEKYSAAHHNGKKFVDYMRVSIRYAAADDLLRYRWLREANLSSEYLSFLRSISWTDEQNASSTEYYSFMREYLRLLSAQKQTSEQGMVSIVDVLEKTIASGKEITPTDKSILERFAQLQKTAHLPETQQALHKDSVVFKRVFAKYQSLLDETANAIVSERKGKLSVNLQTHIIDSLPRGIGRDIMLGRMADEQLSNQRTLTAEELSVYQAAMQTPALYAEIVRRNTALANKLNGNGPRNTEILSPIATSAKNVLESLVGKYKGNVVYVDFWAPWCGPCMGEMPQAKILKEELTGKNVTFLYLCVNCSEQSWTNTIKAKEIGGQHYRLSKDEFSVLSNQFQITGIPRYFLVNQEGVIVDENATRPSDKSRLIKKIDELLK